MTTMQGMLDHIHNWRDQSACKTASTFQADLVNSYWQKEEVWRAYQVCYFHTRVLANYREAMAIFPCYRLRVTPGSELLELRSIYSRSKTSKTPFPMLKVKYAFDLDEASFAELDTQDCVGPTRRYLGQCWTQFWNDSGVYGSIFEVADGGHTRSVKALTRPQLNKLPVANLKIFGLLCFLLALYGQHVDRPMIHSTIALACGWRPNMENPASVDAYEGDYEAVKPSIFTVLNALIRAKSMEENVAAKSAILADREYAEIFCAVSALDADAPPDGPLPTFLHYLCSTDLATTDYEGDF